MPPEGPPPQEPGRATPCGRGRPGAAVRWCGRSAIVGVLLVLFVVFTGYYTEWLWFRSVGFSSVFTKQLTTRLLLFGFFGLLMAASLAFTMWLAHRLRPAFRGMTQEQQNLERYRVSLEPVRRRVVIGVAVLFGLLAGGTAAGQWRQYLLFVNSQPFRISDPQFGTDVSFYAFRLPFLRYLVGFGFATTFLCLVIAAVVHYLYGGIKLQSPGERFTPAARAHLSVLLGIFVLLKTVVVLAGPLRPGHQATGTCFTGAGYTDVNGDPAGQEHPRRGSRWSARCCSSPTCSGAPGSCPVLGLGLLILSAVVIGGIYPAIVQQFQVRPSREHQGEPVHRAQHRRDADSVRPVRRSRSRSTRRTSTPTAAALAADRSTVDNVRLLDPAVVSQTFQQLQQIRGFYGFADPLDVDRYTINGVERDAVVAVREIDYAGCPRASGTGPTAHDVYTHGYGFVARLRQHGRRSRASRTSSPTTCRTRASSTITQPRIYFGENTHDVLDRRRARRGRTRRSSTSPTTRAPPARRTTPTPARAACRSARCSTGCSSPSRFQEPNILLSDLVNSDSKILWDRTRASASRRSRPWLTVDGDPYPAVVDGRIVWIVDGYTTSNGYPYSQRTTLGRRHRRRADREHPRRSRRCQSDQVNYIRNSVKAVGRRLRRHRRPLRVGHHRPGAARRGRRRSPAPCSRTPAIPPTLLAHLRYPEDLFKVQREPARASTT